jgi:hypothetical protein
LAFIRLRIILFGLRTANNVLHIELLNGPVTGDSSSKHLVNGGRFHN